MVILGEGAMSYDRVASVGLRVQGGGGLGEFDHVHSTTSSAIGHGSNPKPALEATQGHMDGFFDQLSYKCYLGEGASVGD